MGYEILSGSEIVGTDPSIIFSFRPRDLSSLVVKVRKSVSIGTMGVSSDKGLPLAAGEGFSISHQDFDLDLLAENPLLNIYGVAAVETYADWLAVRR